MNFFVTCPRNVEDLLAVELGDLGADQVKVTSSGAGFSGSLETAYKICYQSRLANRIFLPLVEFDASTSEQLYAQALQIKWDDHFSRENTFALSCTLKSSFIRNSNYAAVLVKDAVADYFREKTGQRPSVKTDFPDIRINLHMDKTRAVISLDLAGESLHKRGYRKTGSPANLKENAAAALLLRAGWPGIAAGGGSFVDPMCGSGTLLLEAAYLAAGIPAGKLRRYYGFLKWKQHDPRLWQKVVQQADALADTGHLVPLIGYDGDRQAVRAALINIREAGLESRIHVEKRDLKDADHPARCAGECGLVAVNPPYGVRLGEESQLVPLYKELGGILIRNFRGWHASILSASRELSHAIGLRAVRINHLYNGPLKCLLSHFEIREDTVFRKYAVPAPMDLTGDIFANRLKKNLKHLGRWAKRNGISCYRLYDADVPEYAAAIDYYEGKYLHVQEYAPPASIDKQKAARRFKHLVNVCSVILEIPMEHIFCKQRRQQKGAAQYPKQDSAGEFHIIRENNLRFRVNFTDYLDPGIFLNSRFIRRYIQSLAKGRNFLNLFAYTGTATVYAAAGGAAGTVSVDTSRTYSRWAGENLALNGFAGGRHRFIREDCLRWLTQNRQKFPLIFLEPPTFSNTGKEGRLFDLQKQHVQLVNLCMQSLAEDGILIFSNNSRRFKLDLQALDHYRIRDLQKTTLPEDFRRKPGLHHCWQFSYLPAESLSGSL